VILGPVTQDLCLHDDRRAAGYSKSSVTKLNSAPEVLYKSEPISNQSMDVSRQRNATPISDAGSRSITSSKSTSFQPPQSNFTNGGDVVTSEASSFKTPISAPILQNPTHPQIKTNISSNNNILGERFHHCPLDSLTAESITSSPFTSSKTARMSAAERLGLKKAKSGLPSGILKKSPPKYENDKHWKVQQRVDVPTPTTESTSRKLQQKSKNLDRKISVQVYNLPGKDHLKKDDHYGSFIALVGSAIDTEHSKHPASIPVTQKSVLSQSAPDSALHIPNFDESSYSGADSNAESAFRPAKSKPFWYEPKIVIETFSPAGKGRQNYPDGEFNSANLHYPSRARISSRNTNFDARYQNWFGSEYKPSAPVGQYQRHGRSYSLGDSCASDSGQTYHVTNPHQFQPSQYAGMMYENHTYEDFHHFRNQPHKATLGATHDCLDTNSSLGMSYSSSYSNSSYHQPQTSPGTSLAAPGNVPVSGRFYRRNSGGAAYSNPSYELRPLHQVGRGRYDFPQNRRPPTLFASLQENSSTLSWV